MKYNHRKMLFISIFVLGLVGMSGKKIPCTGWWFDTHPKLKQECQHNLLFKEKRGEAVHRVEDRRISPPIANSSQFSGMLNDDCLSWNITRNLDVAETCKELGNPTLPYKLTPLPPATQEWYGTPYPMNEPAPYPPALTEVPPPNYPTSEPTPYPEPIEEPAPPYPTNEPAAYPEPNEDPAPPYPTSEPIPYPEPIGEPAPPYPTDEPAPYPGPGEEPAPLPPYP